MDEESVNDETLTYMFDSAFQSYNEINNTTEATNSDTIQLKVRKTITKLENATYLVSLVSMFSENETIEEVDTEQLKYFLLPFLLGMLKLKLCGGNRKEILDTAEIYLKDYLKRAYNYGLIDVNPSESLPKKISGTSMQSEQSELEMIKNMIYSRQTKIQRYQEQKELESKLSHLKRCLDGDLRREYYLTLLKSCVLQATDELKSIDMEKPMLEMITAKSSSKMSGSSSRINVHSSKPLKPVLITKDDVQKAVFGAGYPSLPIMTVQEFYDKRVQDGIFPDPTKVKEKSIENMSLQEMALAGVSRDEDEEKITTEIKEETDDPDHLDRLRRKDELKDEFRRGYGNRMNRS